MSLSGFAYAFAVLGVVVGMAALLAAEFFHGLDVLLPVGGALAMVAVGALTALVGRSDPPADATGEH